jgi:hypothetical protein
MKYVESYVLRTFCFAALSFILLTSGPVFAANSITITPPVDSNGKLCTGMLQTDGKGKLSCFTGLSGNMNNGDVTQSGPVYFTNGVIINSRSANLGDKNSAVVWQNLVDECHGNPGNIGVDASGNLHCCPLGQVVTGAGTDSVSCGELH